MVDDNILNDLFIQLSKRLLNENDLSDMFWAVMNAVPALKKDLCELFEFEIADDNPIDIQREVAIPTGRPDFIINSGDRSYIIEVKIYDTNYHFFEYDDFKKTNGKVKGTGLLINHTISSEAKKIADQLGWKVITWKELLNWMLKNIDNYRNSSKFIIIAFWGYLKEVCNMVTEIDLRFGTGLNSLYVFPVIIKEIIEKNKDVLQIEIYSRQDRAFGQGRTGAYFQFTGKKIWLFFGIIYERERIGIAVSIDEDWNGTIVQKVRSSVNQTNMNFIIENYQGGRGVHIFLPDDKFVEFNEAKLEKQKDTLDEFFVKVNLFIESLI